MREPPRSTKPALAAVPAAAAPASAAPAAAAPASAAPAAATFDTVEWEQTPAGVRSLRLGAARLRVTLDDRRYDLGADALLDWVSRSARAIRDYYGAFPVREAELVVHATRGSGVHGGHTEPGAPPRIDIEVGERASLLDLARNWSLAHEMVHLAVPNLARSQHWLEEGLASYVEPIARARAGLRDEKDVWREWRDNLARGLPEADDRGLDHTPTWGRTYWGGALYCFLADLEIRKRSGGRFELRDALRGILAAGGNINVDWPIERVLRAGDAATQTDVLAQLYAQMKDQPVRFDLAQIWRELGVSEQGGEIRYDDSAPLASVRAVFVRGR